MTGNNFFTHIKKWGKFMEKTGNPPKFFKQIFSVDKKEFIPFDELRFRLKGDESKKFIPHFFIDDSKQTCFADNPDKYSNILDSTFAVCSPDYSVFLNVFPAFNNAVILLGRLVASYWQQKGHFVVLTLTWANEETFDMAFDNIEEGSIVAISTQGVSDYECFKRGFLEMLQRVKPSFICFHDKIPEWIYDVFPKDKITIIPKRHEQVKQRIKEKQLSLFSAD